MHFQWYPGHMTKAKRMMQENITFSDIGKNVIFIDKGKTCHAGRYQTN